MVERFEELQEKVLEWADSHDLLHEENANKQFMKFIEETFEFKTEMDQLLSYRKYCEETCKRLPKNAAKKMELEMGDVFVTLIILCKQIEIEPQECLEMAYEKIKDRKGKTINGCFIKAEDLHD